jgi:hypothetical protein
MGTRNIIRERYWSNSQRVVGSCIWRKRGLRRDALASVSRPYAVQRTERVFGEMERERSRSARKNVGAFAMPWKRTHAGPIGVEWADRQDSEPVRQVVPKVARVAPAIHGDPCVLQLLSRSGRSIAMHANWRSSLTAKRMTFGRSPRLLFSPCQTRPIKSDLRRTGI